MVFEKVNETQLPMLSTESQVVLDALWNEFWPATDIKPLAVVDFINSIFFIRYLEEVQDKKERTAQFYNKPVESSIYANDQQEFRWSNFQDMDRNQLYQLFNRPENNLLQFARTTGEYRKWSKFDEGPTPLVAIPELLEATVKMVGNLETADVHTRAEMNRYLLKKIEDAAQKPTEVLPYIPPELKSLKGRRSFLQNWNIAIILLVIFISGFAIAYFYFSSKNKGAASSITNTTVTDTAITPLRAENTVKKNTVEKKTPQKKNNPKKEDAVSKPKTATAKPEEIAVQKDIPTGEIKGKYKIVSKAYFHNEPDESTRRNAFVVHWNNSYATLNALDEENGFVYVVFRNDQNQTSKGWLRKKDLRPID